MMGTMRSVMTDFTRDKLSIRDRLRLMQRCCRGEPSRSGTDCCRGDPCRSKSQIQEGKRVLRDGDSRNVGAMGSGEAAAPDEVGPVRGQSDQPGTAGERDVYIYLGGGVFRVALVCLPHAIWVSKTMGGRRLPSFSGLKQYFTRRADHDRYTVISFLSCRCESFCRVCTS